MRAWDGSTGSVSLSDLEAACTPAQSPSSTFGHSSSWESGLADEAGRSPHRLCLHVNAIF